MASRRVLLILTVLPLALFPLVGCDSPGFTRKVQSPTSEPLAAVGAVNTTGAPLASGEGLSGVPFVETPGLTVSNAIANACGLAARADGKNVTPSFEYDSATLVEEDRILLAQVAKCLSEGALRGKSVRLVGRADPRGEDEYNMSLGGSRADSVKRYLVSLGVGRERMMSTSRGEMDATGTTEVGFAHDRRVDLELAP